MKTALLSTAIAAVLFAGSASAHTINGGALASNTDAYDVYHTSCFSWGDGTHPAAVAPEVNGAADHLRFTVRGTGAGQAVVKLTVGIANTSTTWLSNSTTDTSNGNGVVATDFDANNNAPTGYATAKNVAGGNGDYTLVFSHNAGQANGYDAILHCQNASNQHTGTGSFFTGTAPNVVPSVDYDQLINN